LALIAYATLSPTSFRPRLLGEDESELIAAIERFCAFAVLGLFVNFAFGGGLVLSLVTVAVAASLLELLQSLQPGRHAEVLDVLQKMIGGTLGIVLARALPSFVGRKP
jgi:VanZ family protein